MENDSQQVEFPQGLLTKALSQKISRSQSQIYKENILYDKSIMTSIKNQEIEQSNTLLQLKIVELTNQTNKKMRIYLYDEGNFLFFYYLELAENNYQELIKLEENEIDFTQLSTKIVEVFELLNSTSHEHSQISCNLEFQGSDYVNLEVQEDHSNNQIIVHISFTLNKMQGDMLVQQLIKKINEKDGELEELRIKQQKCNSYLESTSEGVFQVFQKFQEQIQEYQNQNTKLKEELKNAQIKEKQNQIRIENDIAVKYENEKEKAQQQFQMEIEQLKANLIMSQQQNQENSSQKTILEQQVKNLQEQNYSLQEKNKLQEQKSKSLEQKVEDMQFIIQQLKNQTQKNTEVLQDKIKTLHSKKQSIQYLQDQQKQIIEQSSQQKQELEEKVKQVENYKDQNTELINTNQVLTKKAQEKKQKIKQLQNNYKELLDLFQEAQERQTIHEQQLNDQIKLYEDLQEKYQTLERFCEEQKNKLNKSKTLLEQNQTTIQYLNNKLNCYMKPTSIIQGSIYSKINFEENQLHEEKFKQVSQQNYFKTSPITKSQKPLYFQSFEENSQQRSSYSPSIQQNIIKQKHINEYIQSSAKVNEKNPQKMDDILLEPVKYKAQFDK